ncbi:hypothetical protein [Pseudactinotalea suaedae]|uniref:hypothetical protein n=1 Tax=Pseudactinotalea suaedae TaxID=1524924 RepID=UPI0012E28438|nr:hypothetical protein [Pseudactinotalea suaedae]
MSGALAWWQLLIGAVVTVAGSWVAARYANRASVKVAQVSVEEGAFLRAEGIYKNAISRLEEELDVERKARQALAAEFKTAREEWKTERGELQARIETLEKA